jgi:uncharacterized protein
MNEFDDLVVNPTGKKSLTELASPQRRNILISSAIAALFSQNTIAATEKTHSKLFSFDSVPYSRANDDIQLPNGYQWSVVAAWGDSINGSTKSISTDVSDSAKDQENQFGMHHDGCTFFPIKVNGLDSVKGIWVTNHEYTDDGLLHSDGMATWTADKVKKSQAAHGVTIAIIEKSIGGDWSVVADKRARRVTANTPCLISGPAAGSTYMKTAVDQKGREVLGTLNNCANGVTPWGTYLTCEENFNGYFVKADKPNLTEARVGVNAKGFGYRWHEFDERFNLDKHPNEINRFGWIVEIDPQNPEAKPIKRTALGRFKHEGAMVTVAKNKKVVVYMGDDQKSEYVYKFVSKRVFNPSTPEANLNLLDEGTLFVARYDADGLGRWIALEHNRNGLTPANGFPDQAYIVINPRLAADFVGATPMDRPEWIAVHPQTKDVYVTLTNNTDRGTKVNLNAANPRVSNSMGHIVRWTEANGDNSGTVFKWEIYTLAGDPHSTKPHLRGNVIGDTLGSPDGLWFDKRGILWTQTDISTSALGKGDYAQIPNNAMYASDPQTREFRRFLIGPKGCEITGVDMTPDMKTMFINIQHPGESPSERSDPKNPKAISSWPDKDKFTRPRSATIAIWRTDGKNVGA